MTSPKNPELMPKQNLLGWTDKFGYLALASVLAISAAVFFAVDSQLTSQQKPRSHDTWVDKNGHLHVLGLTLGITTLRQAEIALKSRSDIALYTRSSQDNHGKDISTSGTLSLEAFFPSIADHSKIILGLDASAEVLRAMREHATLPRIYPNGIIRMNLAGTSQIAAQDLKVNWIKFVPSVDVTHDMLKARFGAADKIKSTANSAQYYYPKIGLIARLTNSGKDELMFSTPNSDNSLDKLPTYATLPHKVDGFQ